jgi:hypothetical protein
MTTTLTNQQAKIEDFIRFFKRGTSALVKAGELLVEMVDEDPHVYDYIIQKCPNISAAILSKFEQMGRKNLHPDLLFTNAPGYSKLQRLPFSMQERYIEESVPVIIHTEEGTDVLLVKAKDMTKEQAAQVFAPGRIRTEGEQKAWLMQQRSIAARPANKETEGAWKIRANKLIVGQVEFTSKELAAILAQITK